MQHGAWWQTAVFYQIYPRSFADDNGDGIGDLAGIISKLDYLRDLGIDAIWLSPHFPSPLYDCGYDVADYCAVAPEYGTLSEFKQFLDSAHQRGIRVVLDLVLNHTSDQHAWFLESRSSLDNPKRDWYVWRKGNGTNPPNNWNSTFGGPAWTLDEVTGEYYYHFFFKQQPDLNWRNPEVKQAMFEAVRFWLDLGVDGFRLDAIGTIYEDAAQRNHTATWSQEELFAASWSATTPEEKLLNHKQWMAMFGDQVDQPEVHSLMRELRQLVDQYPDRVLIGETDHVAFYGDGTDELHMVFNFPLMRQQPLTPALIHANQTARLAELPPDAWPCNTLGNHDAPRIFNHFGDGKHDDQLARLSLILMLTLRGTPFLYNGEEIGMTDFYLSELGAIRDMFGVWLNHTLIDVLGKSPAEALQLALQHSRDKCRTPLQWDNNANAGFSPADVTTWLPVNPNYADGVNVAEQQNDPNSLLNFYRSMLALRRANPALQVGDYQPLQTDHPDCLVFVRRTAEQHCLVILNFSERVYELDLSHYHVKRMLYPSATNVIPAFGIVIVEV